MPFLWLRFQTHHPAIRHRPPRNVQVRRRAVPERGAIRARLTIDSSIAVTLARGLVSLFRQRQQNIEKFVALALEKSRIGQEMGRRGCPSEGNGGRTNDRTRRQIRTDELARL